jgi:lipid II:glycine glycyltransferase (peptidoglycan interpeptide bridge formation enzyme)
MIEVEKCTDAARWDATILERGGHPLQLWGWGDVKQAHNWGVERVFLKRGEDTIGAAQILIRRLPKPFTALAYIPRGPVAKEGDRGEVLQALADFAKQHYRPVAITIEPDWAAMPSVTGWKKSSNTILIPRTLILDLTKTDDELLAGMAKKTRQYIRKSGNEAIEIRRVKGREALDACLAIYRQTADRAGFALHGDKYYHDVFEKLGDHSPVFAAYHNGVPVAFLWLAVSSETAFELYGGMDGKGQELRANYALKWHAIQTMKRWGVRRYDMNGLLNDGVSVFKQGFASHEDMLAGTFDKPLSPLYIAWSKGLPAAKALLRRVKR